MEYRSLGRTGVQVSEVCLGCMMFGGRTELDDSIRIVDMALDADVNFVDTANAYSGGKSEEHLGEALKRNGKRDKIVLATKVFAPMDRDDPNARGNHRRHIIEQCEASLRRLQTDWIDLYQIHRPMSTIPIDETLRALDDLVRSGKVRYLGTSTYAAWQLVESLWVSKEYGLDRFVCEQPPYHLLDRTIEQELIPFAQTYGFGIIPWSPLAGGFLAGKYKRGESGPEDGRYAKRDNKTGRGGSGTPEAAYDVLEALEAMAAEKGCTISQLALAWVAKQPGISSAICGPRTVEQMEDNLGAVDVEFSEDDLKRIDEVAPPKRATVYYYYGEADWKPPSYRW